MKNDGSIEVGVTLKVNTELADLPTALVRNVVIPDGEVQFSLPLLHLRLAPGGNANDAFLPLPQTNMDSSHIIEYREVTTGIYYEAGYLYDYDFGINAQAARGDDSDDYDDESQNAHDNAVYSETYFCFFADAFIAKYRVTPSTGPHPDDIPKYCFCQIRLNQQNNSADLVFSYNADPFVYVNMYGNQVTTCNGWGLFKPEGHANYRYINTFVVKQVPTLPNIRIPMYYLSGAQSYGTKLIMDTMMEATGLYLHAHNDEKYKLGHMVAFSNNSLEVNKVVSRLDDRIRVANSPVWSDLNIQHFGAAGLDMPTSCLLDAFISTITMRPTTAWKARSFEPIDVTVVTASPQQLGEWDAA